MRRLEMGGIDACWCVLLVISQASCFRPVDLDGLANFADRLELVQRNQTAFPALNVLHLSDHGLLLTETDVKAGFVYQVLEDGSLGNGQHLFNSPGYGLCGPHRGYLYCCGAARTDLPGVVGVLSLAAGLEGDLVATLDVPARGDRRPSVLFFDGDRVGVFGGEGKVAIFDATVLPSEPQLVATIEDQRLQNLLAGSVYEHGGTKYWLAATMSEVFAFTVDEAFTPTFYSGVPLAQGGHDPGGLTTHASTAYVSNATNVLYVVDLSDPTQPSLAATVEGVASALAPAVLSEELLVANTPTGVAMLSIRDPSSPHLLNTVRVSSIGNLFARWPFVFGAATPQVLAFKVFAPDEY